MPRLKPEERLIVALDTDTLAEAEAIVKKLVPKGVDHFKVGLGLFTETGPEAIRMVRRHGGRVFPDLKFHDIPNTAAHAVRSAVRWGVWMTNLHLFGGAAMAREALAAARAESARQKGTASLLVGVTVLTSMDDAALSALGIRRGAREQALHLAKMAKSAGLAGVVASPQEAAAIRRACGAGFLIVTPGVRPAGDASWKEDQKRVATPSAAVAAGADYIVVGRPITQAEDPSEAAERIIQELEGNAHATE
ncbi:MAG: orotidine-5'-phosphate decarboxylase [Candidatus Omnitrophica bacterium CG11_big_fil_rev_8_21_14_0_20_64_10]|nr:MAG: orotidine-5'-phosphate decarboxylase [Candidatus Omnitrophica bacterium CG11_big_fil_rev_8_21_14_0_20_64_10]